MLLVAGEVLTIVTGPSVILGNASRISCSYVDLASSVRPGGLILVADGEISLRVEACRPYGAPPLPAGAPPLEQGAVRARVLNTSTLGERSTAYTKKSGSALSSALRSQRSLATVAIA